MKLVIISLDLLLALPFLSVAVALLFSNMINTQTYLLALGSLENRTLNLFVTSQQIAEKIDSGMVNYSVASGIASRISGDEGFEYQISNVSSGTPCQNSLELCRIITISGSSRLLVVYYENPNQH